MALEAQVVGTWGRLEGDPQLRGHFGRIPFDLFVPSSGKVALSDAQSTAVLLSAGGATVALSDAPSGSAALTAGGATVVLFDNAVDVDLSEDC